MFKKKKLHLIRHILHLIFMDLKSNMKHSILSHRNLKALKADSITNKNLFLAFFFSFNLISYFSLTFRQQHMLNWAHIVVADCWLCTEIPFWYAGWNFQCCLIYSAHSVCHSHSVLCLQYE